MQFAENNTLFIGKNLITLKKVDSTNNYAKLLLANSGPVPSGTVILADEQFGGRGQGSATWVSEPEKNLTFSVVLHNEFLSPADQFYLSMVVSLGMAEGLSLATGAMAEDPVMIKWPNDIYRGTRKMGGILVENILAGTVLKTSVAGIGLNVNQERFPGLPQATSLKLETGKEFLLKPLLTGLCRSLEARYLQLRRGDREQLTEAYLLRLLGYNHSRFFREKGLPGDTGPHPGTPSRIFEGIIRGVTREGRLLVEVHEGIRSFEKKEIEFLF